MQIFYKKIIFGLITVALFVSFGTANAMEIYFEKDQNQTAEKAANRTTSTSEGAGKNASSKSSVYLSDALSFFLVKRLVTRRLPPQTYQVQL
jgi:hypothetical protein